MNDIYPKIRELGGEVLVVSFSAVKFVAHYVAKYPLPFPVVSDPDKTAYKTFALGRTPWWTFARPDVIWKYIRLMLRGWKLWKLQEKDDLLQLGGDFVVDGHRRVMFAYPSQNPTDRPDISEIVRVLEELSRL